MPAQPSPTDPAVPMGPAAGGGASPPARMRRVLTAQPVDAVTVLSVYVVLLYALPSKLVFAPLGGAGTPAQLVGLGCALWWAWHHVHRSHATAAGRQPVRTAALVFVVCVLASYVAAMTRPILAEEASTADLGLIALLGWTGVLLVANDGITTTERTVRLLRRLAFAGAAVAVLGIAQFATGQAFVDQIDIPGLSANQALSGAQQRDGFTRPAGTASHPIEYGVVLTMLLPIALGVAMHRDGRHAIRRWFPPVVLGLAIMLSISRSAIVGAILGLVVLIPTWPRAARAAALATLALMVTFVFVAVPGMIGTLTGLFTGISGDSSAQSRTGSYTIAAEFIARAPLFGRGLSTFLPRYRILDNQYLLFAIEIGIIGLLASLALVVTGLLSTRATRRSSTDEAVRGHAQALAAAIAAGGVSLALFDAFSFSSVPGTLFLLLGMGGALRRITRTGTAVGGGPAHRGPSGLADPPAASDLSDAPDPSEPQAPAAPHAPPGSPLAGFGQPAADQHARRALPVPNVDVPKSDVMFHERAPTSRPGGPRDVD